MARNLRIEPVRRLAGTIAIPGDKSLSHRSIMLAGLADTPVVVRNFLAAEDCLSTVSCMRALGVSVDIQSDGQVIVQGKGLYGLNEPENVLDTGNSGTTIRLLSGLLTGQPFFSVLTGDDSLRRRPMARIVTPLTQMGGRLVGRENSRYAPMAVEPTGSLNGIDYHMPVASAQVKSAIMFAALYADSATTITEPYLSRDHTERMFVQFGVEVFRSGLSVRVNPVRALKAPATVDVPGDFSSAAFLLVAATIIPGSELLLTHVGVNPTRTGLLEVLRHMGADIEVVNERLDGEEPVADLRVRSARLKGISVGSEMIPRLIDEIPILAVAALFAEGQTLIQGAEELRVKETDRLRAMACELKRMGGDIAEKPDGLLIQGNGRLKPVECLTYNDHRVAMALAVAGMAAAGVELNDSGCVAISFPGFFETVEGCCK
jgi:3-phosphoshikimate 1-carboxyvinyltransferase